MGLPTCEFIRETQNPAARDAQPVGYPIPLLLLPLHLGCALLRKKGLRPWIMSAFESLQYMKVSLIYGAMLVVLDERGNSVRITKRVECKRGFYPERKPLVPKCFPQDGDRPVVPRDGKLSNEANSVGLPQGFAALQIGFDRGH